MVVMLFGGNQDSEPRQPSSRDTGVLSCCCFLLLLLRCCCERLTVLELFVLLAEVWRGAAVPLLFSLSFVLSATLRWKVELQLQVMWRKRE